MVRLGTRGSLLARTQSGHVAAALERAGGPASELVVIRSEGDDHTVPLDSPSRPGAFVATLRDALLAGQVDLVVHSYKDLPTAPVPGLVLAAVPTRSDPGDVLVTAGRVTLADLPAGATIGTSSPRRAKALLRMRPDATIVPIRGNIDTRVAMVERGDVDAVVLAAAGLSRLGRLADAGRLLDPRLLVPAPAQGALAVECRAGEDLVETLATLDDPVTRLAVTAERAVLAGVEAACTTAVGALATWSDGVLELVADLAGHRGVDYAHRYAAVAVPDPADLSAAEELGWEIARSLLAGQPR